MPWIEATPEEEEQISSSNSSRQQRGSGRWEPVSDDEASSILYQTNRSKLPPVPYEVWEGQPSLYGGPSQKIAEGAAAVMEPVAEAVHFVDKYNPVSGVPARRAIYEAQQGGDSRSIGEAYRGGFGEDTAPTFSDIYHKAGVPRTPAAVAGFGTEVALDPAMYLGGPAMKGIEKGAEVAGKVAKSPISKEVYNYLKSKGSNAVDQTLKKTGRMAVGIPEEATETFLKNRHEVDKYGKIPLDKYSADIGEVRALDEGQRTNVRNRLDSANYDHDVYWKTKKNELSNDFASQGEINDARANIKDLDAEKNQYWKNKQYELGRGSASSDYIRQIQNAMNQNKELLGAMSDKADDILVKSNYLVPKEDVLKIVDDLGASLGPNLASEIEVNAANRLMALRNRLEQFPETFDGPLLRKTMRSIRKETGWDYAAGEFNEIYDKLRKDFTETVSGALKKYSPEYSKHMDEMKELVDAHNDMMREFGRESSAVAAVERMRKGGNLKSKLTQEKFDKFQNLTGQNALGEEVARIQKEYDLYKKMGLQPDEAHKILMERDPEYAKFYNNYAAKRASEVNRDAKYSNIKQENRDMSKLMSVDPQEASNMLRKSDPEYLKMSNHLRAVGEVNAAFDNYFANSSRVSPKSIDALVKRLARIPEQGEALNRLDIESLQAVARNNKEQIDSFLRLTDPKIAKAIKDKNFDLAEKLSEGSDFAEVAVQRARLDETMDNIVHKLKMKGVNEEFKKAYVRGSRMSVVAGGTTALLTKNPFLAGTAAFGAEMYGRRGFKNLVLRPVAFSREHFNKMENMMTLAPKMLGKFLPILRRAQARGGDKALVTTHHTLMNSFPDYRQIFMPNEQEVYRK